LLWLFKAERIFSPLTHGDRTLLPTNHSLTLMTHSLRSLLTRLTSIASVLALTAFLFGCSQPTSGPNSTVRTGSILPVAHGNDGGSESIVDIPTPSFTANAISAGTTSGHKICLSWQSNSPDNVTFDYSTGLDPVSGSLNGTYGWEYWGCTQHSIVSSPSYSGHYELRRINPDLTQTSLGDVTADSYCDDNLGEGTYTYYLKAKSREAGSSNIMTHHSAETAGYSVTISSCTNDASGTVNATISSVAVGTGNWSNTSTPSNGPTSWTDNALWTKTANGTGYNIAFNIGQYSWIHNTCNGYSYTFTGGYTGQLYVQLDGGAWIAPLQWVAVTHPYYQINGVSLGALSFGPHVIAFSTTASNVGLLGSFAVSAN
jgi:hypothetical protein